MAINPANARPEKRELIAPKESPIIPILSGQYLLIKINEPHQSTITTNNMLIKIKTGIIQEYFFIIIKFFTSS